MGCDTCGRILLVVVNIIFLIIGLGFTAGGVVVRFFPDLYQDQVNQFVDNIPTISSSGGVDGVTSSGTTGSLDLGSLLSTLGIALLVFGVFVLIISLLGLIGACCKVKALLVIYIILVALVLLGKLAAVIIYATGVVTDQIKDTLNTTIVNDYGGIDDFTIKSISWNFAMLNFKCCGINDYTDFNYASSWNNNRTISSSGYTAGVLMQTPLACCKTSGTFPTSLSIDNDNCTISPTDAISNWKTGCWDKIYNDIFNTHKIISIVVIAVVLGFELLCIISAICILCRSDKDEMV